MAVAGRATAAGTARYAARLMATGAAPEHFRQSQGLTLTSIGAGTYLGEPSDAVDQSYRQALAEAVRCGCNVLDSAVSYRAQRSEIALGQAIADLLASGACARDELVVASKGGFVTYRLSRPADRVQFIYETFVATGVVEPQELAGGIHCLAPDFLSQQISWSLRNTGLHTIDIYYLHDPETQLAFVDRTTFRHRLQLAFARLEEEVVAGRIGCYGIASWNGLRRAPMAADYLSLEIIMDLARSVAGQGHHLRAIQMPVNPVMAEAAVFRNQSSDKKPVSLLAAARDLGLLVMTSASMIQTHLLERLPTSLANAFPYLHSNAQRALQFARSLPGVTTVLAGMSRVDHVHENLALAAYPPEPEVATRRAGLEAGPPQIVESEPNMRAIQAVTFDAGDTLVDLGEGRGDYEARALVRAGRVYEVLAAGGAALAARDSFCPAFVAAIEDCYQSALAEQRGLQADAALHWYFAQSGLVIDQALLQAAAAAYCGQGTAGPLPLRLGAQETLAALAARGLRLGVISNTIQPAQYLDAAWARRGLLDFFSATIYSSEVGVAKPHPGIFRAALDALRVAPEHAVHVGDRLVADVAGAQNAGMRGILIEVAHRPEFAADVRPDARIRELPELLDVLEM